MPHTKTIPFTEFLMLIGSPLIFSMTFEEATEIAQSSFTDPNSPPNFSNLFVPTSTLSTDYANLITTNIGGDTYYKAVSIMSENTWNNYYSSFSGMSGKKSNASGYESWITFSTTDTNSLRGYMVDNKSEYGFNTADAAARAETLLGMNNTGTHTIVAEFWVSADSIFRPAINWDPTRSEISTSWENANDAGPEWFHATYGKTYEEWYMDNASGNEYPWTGLGYTFDYDDSNTEKEEWVGLSEFIIAAEKKFYVISGTPILLYIPEPSLFALFAGTIALGFAGTRRRRKSTSLQR